MLPKFSLGLPQVYHAFQEMGGFFGARTNAISQYLSLKPNARVIDVGCGPGHIAKHLPAGVDYIGFDVEQHYIDYAKRTFGGPKRRFFCEFFDDARALELVPADLVMMNGVLHHMSDADAAQTLSAIAKVLAPDGALFTLDGAYRDGQSGLVKWLLDNDRGQYVRPAAGYVSLLERSFPAVEVHVREDLSRVPYTYAICVARKQPARAEPVVAV